MPYFKQVVVKVLLIYTGCIAVRTPQRSFIPLNTFEKVIKPHSMDGVCNFCSENAGGRTTLALHGSQKTKRRLERDVCSILGNPMPEYNIYFKYQLPFCSRQARKLY